MTNFKYTITFREKITLNGNVLKTFTLQGILQGETEAEILSKLSSSFGSKTIVFWRCEEVRIMSKL